MTAFAAAEAAPKEIKKTFLDVLKEGGWCMWPIGLFSIATVWLAIDIWFRTNPKKMTPMPTSTWPGKCSLRAITSARIRR